ncbi:MAG: hypothetical protein B7Z73_13415, partial [Planctomycetia bacterium 21-64-5]
MGEGLFGDKTTLDDAGRRVELIRNYQSGQPSTRDVNVTVQWTWTADNLPANMTAANAATRNQGTTFNYSATFPSSDVARNDVLSSTVYADGGTVRYLVNRQGERKQLTDQNSTVHAYSRDLLARPTYDSITTLGTGVDGSVLCVGSTYEVRGVLAHATSYSDAAGTNVVNDVLRVYNSFEQLATEYQEHNGAVNTSTSVKVQYHYAEGSANTIRRTGLVYPNGRTITLDYGGSGGIDDTLSRVENLIDDDGTTLVSYTHIGADTFVMQVSPQPRIAWSLVNGIGIDPYTGFDQFDQIADSRWYSTATTLDGLYRLARLDRGQLNSTDDGIVSGTQDFTQAWGLDATDNWSTFSQADTGGSWTLEQTRTANAVNEITAITGGGWAEPSYDAAGNMVSMPQPSNPAVTSTGVFDAWNRLMSLSSIGSQIKDNVYDGLDRRTSKTASGTARHFYYSSDWHSLEERIGSSTTPDRQFVWGLRYIDDLVLRDRDTQRLYAIQDPNWNVTAICDVSNTIQERYLFSAYGVPVFLSASFVPRSSSDYEWNVLYGAYRLDDESGLYCVRRRALNPILGAWCSRDPIGFRSGGTNLYAYVFDMPVLLTDPTGESCWGALANNAAATIAVGVACAACVFPGDGACIGDIAECLACIGA